MSQTALERRHFPVPMCWPHAGNDPSRTGHCTRRSVLQLIHSEPLPRGVLNAFDRANVPICRPHPGGVTFPVELSAGIKSP